MDHGETSCIRGFVRSSTVDHGETSCVRGSVGQAGDATKLRGGEIVQGMRWWQAAIQVLAGGSEVDARRWLRMPRRAVHGHGLADM